MGRVPEGWTSIIQRIDIAGDDSFEKNELLGFHGEMHDSVILFNVKEGTCQDPIKPVSYHSHYSTVGSNDSYKIDSLTLAQYKYYDFAR